MKRDTKYLIELLFEAEKDKDDLIVILNEAGMSDEQRKRYNHAQFLCDDKQLVKVGNATYRLTAQGHAFIKYIRDKSIAANRL